MKDNVIYYAVRDPQGKILNRTLATEIAYAIEFFMAGRTAENWKYYSDLGYEVRRVRIVEVKEQNV